LRINNMSKKSLNWRKHTIMSFHTIYYFVLKKDGEAIYCDECNKLIGKEGKAYVIVPHCRNDEAVDFILCEDCRKKA